MDLRESYSRICTWRVTLTFATLCVLEDFLFFPHMVVRGYGVAKVIKSGYEELKEGEYVWGITSWEDFSWNFYPQQLLIKINITHDVPLSYYAGILGMSGLAAYVGWNEICCPKQGEIVYVSSGAGGVGHLVGQFAKMMGCYVVGSASTNQKVDLLKTELGFDDAFNYKEGDLRSKLNKYFPKGIDIYFDNVGGEMLDEVMLKMNINGRIAASGMISQFHGTDYKEKYPEYAEWAVKKLQEKKLVYVEDVITGLENVVSAFVGIYKGHNIGKRIVVVAEE
ncbi:hypothetical protein DH2020_008508 [Rehmannia glutinosa]|uniref:Alcohol dehydrogenase-like C-terminal domain-containing protein n=1 Tax=Rehmannia glutinosa TaxID=99300 RepID=A0ABR0X795_REHGL